MERLNKDVRTAIGKLLLDSDAQHYENKYVSYSPYDISRREYIHMKAHIQLCYLLANALGFNISDFCGLNLSTDSFLTLLTAKEESYYDATCYEANDEIMDFYSHMESNAIDFLYRILTTTSWNINFISDLYDVEILEDDEIQSLSSLLPYLIDNIENSGSINSSEMLLHLNESKKRFTELGVNCNPEFSGYDYLDSIFYLSNSIIQKAMELCKKNPAYANLPEKREIEEYLNVSVIRRYYEYIEDSPKTGDIAYILGTLYESREENISTFTLSYEAVFLLALAEMAAQDILDYAGKDA